MRLPLVKECPRCLDLACRGDWRECRGAIFDICASMELAEAERVEQRRIDLDRLRDRRAAA